MGVKFSDLINNEIPVLVDFFATWCGPCKMMTPVLEEVKSQVGEQARILKIDVDKNPKLAEIYQIKGVPTFILFKGGKQLWRQSGAISGHELIELLLKNK